MTKTVTPLQAAMLTKIARSEYNSLNGREPKCYSDLGPVWAMCTIETNEDKGVFTSLMNAGLVRHSAGSKMDAIVWLTPEGFEAYTASIS